MKTAGRIFKVLFHTVCILVVFGTFALAIWRISMLGTPNEIKGLAPNERLCEAYRENGNSLTLYNQEQSSLTRAEHNSGYFGAIDVIFIKEAQQLQVVFRYNISTLKHLKEDYSLAEVPDRNGDYFNVTVSVSTDLTPENKEDNEGNDPTAVKQERYHPTSSTRYQNSIYNYEKLVFDGINVDEDTLAVYLDVYYEGAIDYSKQAYGTLCLYDYKLKRIDRKLEKSEIYAIENFNK